MKEFGTIRLTKGEVLATDPCYDKGTWCTVPIKNVRAGNYKAYVEETDQGSWGIRNARLYLVHEDYNPEELNFVEIPGSDAGVDAGVCGFFEDKPNYDDDAWDKLCDNEFEENDRMFGIASVDNNFKCVGCWSESGYGDGGYPVFTAEDRSGYVVGMMVEYISDEEDEDEEDEE